MCLRGRLRGRFGESGGGRGGEGERGAEFEFLSLWTFYIMERASDKGLSFLFHYGNGKWQYINRY